MLNALDTVQAAIYKARWVDAYGKNANLATDEDIARAVCKALFETGETDAS